MAQAPIPMRKTRQDEVRAKIQVGNILDRVRKHLEGEIELSATQMKAAELLLRKSLPDLSSIEVTGAEGGPVQIDAALSPTDAYLKLLGKK
jgi:hypothetical protein